MSNLHCITWNVHRARGQDGRVDPDRVMSAIDSALVPHGPTVLALQEADGECRPHARIFDMERIARDTGLTYVHDTPDLRWGPQSDGFLGTILFLHPDFQRDHADVIDLPGHCHRGAVAIEARYLGTPVRIMSAHLSLTQALRILQMRIIGQYLRRRPVMPTIVLGDLNEWRPWGGFAFSPRLIGQRLLGPVHATFPTGRPLLPLDRVLAGPGAKVEDARVIDTPETNMASDHRPLWARVSFGT